MIECGLSTEIVGVDRGGPAKEDVFAGGRSRISVIADVLVVGNRRTTLRQRRRGMIEIVPRGHVFGFVVGGSTEAAKEDKRTETVLRSVVVDQLDE